MFLMYSQYSELKRNIQSLLNLSYIMSTNMTAYTVQINGNY
jgi:hypothetical protein